MTRSSGNSSRSNLRVNGAGATPLHAHQIHFGHRVGLVDLRHHRPLTSRPSNRSSSIRDIVLALFLAAGLSTVFLAPVQTKRSDESTVSHPRVLGSSVIVPLTVTVSVHAGDTSWYGSVRPAHGTLIEAVTAAAEQSGLSFSYVSRGTSIYPQESTGWTVRLNGVLVNDLSLPLLHQADTITLEHLSI